MPEPPHSVPRDQLPAVTEDQITHFFTLVAPLLEASSEKGASAVKPEDPADLRALLDAMGGVGAGDVAELAHLPHGTGDRLQAAFENSKRAIRPLCLSRKNALFASGDDGGRRWAGLASLIETCKLNGGNPQVYLTDLLTRLVNGWPQSSIDELMPWHWAPAKAGC